MGCKVCILGYKRSLILPVKLICFKAMVVFCEAQGTLKFVKFEFSKSFLNCERMQHSPIHILVVLIPSLVKVCLKTYAF